MLFTPTSFPQGLWPREAAQQAAYNNFIVLKANGRERRHKFAAHHQIPQGQWLREAAQHSRFPIPQGQRPREAAQQAAYNKFTFLKASGRERQHNKLLTTKKKIPQGQWLREATQHSRFPIPQGQRPREAAQQAAYNKFTFLKANGRERRHTQAATYNT
jgi:hypothetical protein